MSLAWVVCPGSEFLPCLFCSASCKVFCILILISTLSHMKYLLTSFAVSDHLSGLFHDYRNGTFNSILMLFPNYLLKELVCVRVCVGRHEGRWCDFQQVLAFSRMKWSSYILALSCQVNPKYKLKVQLCQYLHCLLVIKKIHPQIIKATSSKL